MAISIHSPSFTGHRTDPRKDFIGSYTGLESLGGASMDERTLIEERLQTMSFHQLEDLAKLCGTVKRTKYPSHRGKPLYGNLPRVFTHDQLLLFFRTLKATGNRDVYTAFCRQFFYGLRIGEMNNCKVVPGQDLVQIYNEKCNRIEYMPLIHGTAELFRLLNHGKGYNPHYLRKYFRETCVKAGLTFEYGAARGGRRLHQFTTHSLRRTAGNLVRTVTGDPYKASVFLRHDTHSIYGATSFYMHYDLEDMRSDVVGTFGDLVSELLK